MTPNPTTKGMSEAEVLAVWDRLYDWLPDLDHPDNSELQVHRDARVARSTIESTFAELAELHRWRRDVSEGLGFGCEAGITWTAEEILRGVQAEERKERQHYESDRTALLEVVRRLLPYAQGHADPDNPGSVALAAEARALLSRITAPEASR